MNGDDDFPRAYRQWCASEKRACDLEAELMDWLERRGDSTAYPQIMDRARSARETATEDMRLVLELSRRQAASSAHSRNTGRETTRRSARR